jgi:hypothetical protein
MQPEYINEGSERLDKDGSWSAEEDAYEAKMELHFDTMSEIRTIFGWPQVHPLYASTARPAFPEGYTPF